MTQSARLEHCVEVVKSEPRQLTPPEDLANKGQIPVWTTAPPIVAVERHPGFEIGLPIKHEMCVIKSKNIPLTKLKGPVARRVRANIEYYHSPDEKLSQSLKPRWWHLPEPGLFPATYDTGQLLEADISAGAEGVLAVAGRPKGGNSLFAYDHDSHAFEALSKPEYELGSDLWYARITFVGENLIRTDEAWVALRIDAKGKFIAEKEMPTWAKEVRREAKRSAKRNRKMKRWRGN